MKTNSSQKFLALCFVGVCLLLFVKIPVTKAKDTMNSKSGWDQMQAFEKLTDIERETTVEKLELDRHQMKELLLEKLSSEKEDVRFYAAYLLGEYRFSQTAASLANIITLEDKVRSKMRQSREWFWDRYPAVEALIKIGTPSIPAMIRNLAENDDAKVRELSLQVLYRIEGDKDIVQLRLQKALAAEKDIAKQARLQSAISALPALKW